MAQRARETFWAPRNRLVREGQIVADDDWVVLGREELFDPMPTSAPAPDVVAELLERIKGLEAAVAAGAPAPAAKTPAKPAAKDKS